MPRKYLKKYLKIVTHQMLVDIIIVDKLNEIPITNSTDLLSSNVKPIRKNKVWHLRRRLRRHA